MSSKVDNIKARGDVTITLRDKDGHIKTRETHNLVVKTGLYHLADLLAGQTQANMSHMAIGTGTTAQTADDTALETELSRLTFVSKDQGTGADANKVTYVCTWASGVGDGDITEAGIFNAASGGVMLCRAADFGVKTKGAGDSLTFTWKIILNA